MKVIEAYIHRSRVAAVVSALQASPAWGGERGNQRHNLAAYIVKGSPIPPLADDRHYSVELCVDVVNEYKLELICDDAEVDTLTDAVVGATVAGQPSRGWLTVTNLVKAVAIR